MLEGCQKDVNYSTDDVHLLATFYSQTLHPSVIISSSQDLIKIASSLHYEFRNQTMKFEMSVLNREREWERERDEPFGV